MNTMQKAHEIRRAAAKKWNCKVSEICFAECLRMAHNNEELTGMTRLETAEQVAGSIGGRVWAPKGEEGIIRVYLAKGYCQVEEDGLNIDAAGRAVYQDLKDYCLENNINAYRA